MATIYDYKSFELGFKDIDKKEGIVSGYFASFNTLDSDGDIFVQGAFTKSIKNDVSR
jgi:phage head maturation protease